MHSSCHWRSVPTRHNDTMSKRLVEVTLVIARPCRAAQIAALAHSARRARRASTTKNTAPATAASSEKAGLRRPRGALPSQPGTRHPAAVRALRAVRAPVWRPFRVVKNMSCCDISADATLPRVFPPVCVGVVEQAAGAEDAVIMRSVSDAPEFRVPELTVYGRMRMGDVRGGAGDCGRNRTSGQGAWLQATAAESKRDNTRGATGRGHAMEQT